MNCAYVGVINFVMVQWNNISLITRFVVLDDVLYSILLLE